jgi:hypothetical protein
MYNIAREDVAAVVGGNAREYVLPRVVTGQEMEVKSSPAWTVPLDHDPSVAPLPTPVSKLPPTMSLPPLSTAVQMGGSVVVHEIELRTLPGSTLTALVQSPLLIFVQLY